MLEESFFIQKQSRTYSFWIVSLFALVLILFVSAIDRLAEKKLNEQQQNSSFFNVTNREISLFLWHYPHLMRVHAKNKIGYLPGFQYIERINIEPGFSEKICIAPPSVLFAYHTWKRLLATYLPKRKIELSEFQEFLTCLPEWQPLNWIAAPSNYSSLMDEEKFADLPLEVIQAFFGWKNYYKEGEAINAFKPTFLELQQFLEKHPHYARHYWKHILKNSVPHYLKTFTSGSFDPSAYVPKEEIAPFLLVALYNFTEK